MAIYKQRGSRFYWVSIYIPGSGNKSIRRSTGTEDKVKAQAIAETMRLALHRKAPADRLHALIDALMGEEGKPVMPLSGAWAEYERMRAIGGRKVEPKTLNQRRRAVERFLAWTTENRPAVKALGDVGRGTAQDYAATLIESGAASKTRKNLISELATVWKELSAVHGIKNPWPGVVPAVNDAKRGKAFTREEEAAILKAADQAGHDWGVISRLARCTGLRYGDIARLTQDSVDRTARALRLAPSKTSRHGIAVLLPLPVAILDALPTAPGPLFPEHAKCLPHQFWVYPYSKVLAAACVGGLGYTFHSWRHTFRTRLAEAGVSDDLAKKLGGWTQDATAARYDHATRLEELRTAVESAL